MSELNRQGNDRIKAGSMLLRLTALWFLLAMVAVGCGGDRDDREEVRKEYGEPDDIEFIEGPISDFENWTYFDYPEVGSNREFRFERARNTCGANRNWILIWQRDYTPADAAPDRIPPAEGPAGSGLNPIKP